jgi:hypothetical protein
MKIVDRKTFLSMPPETLFSKYSPCVFGDLMIKGNTVGENDFLCQQIADAIAHDSSNEFADKLTTAQDTGASLAMDFDYEGRDGMYDHDQLFAVWEPADVVALIERLRRCIGSAA